MPNIWENGMYLFTSQNNLPWLNIDLSTNYPIPFNLMPNSLVLTGKTLPTIDLTINNLGFNSSLSNIPDLKNINVLDWAKLKEQEYNKNAMNSTEVNLTDPLSKFKEFVKENGSVIGSTFDSLNNILPDSDALSGKYGGLASMSGNVYDFASDLMMKVNPLVGGMMKGVKFADSGLSKIFNTEVSGDSKADAILSGIPVVNFINGALGKKADSYTVNHNTDSVISSYLGLKYNQDESLKVQGRRFGIAGSKDRRKANSLIAKTKSFDNTLSDISDYTQDRFALKDSMSAINANRRDYFLNGSYLLNAMRVGKNGLKFINRAKDILSKSKKLLNGGPIDDLYGYYFHTLPLNQRDASNFRVRDYWELHGRPINFEEAIKRGMFTEEPDGWHAKTVAYNKDKDEYEFMKSPNHPSIWMEEAWYNGFEPKKLPFRLNPNTQDREDFELIPLEGDLKKDSDDFRNNYELDKSGDYWKYVRRKKVESHKEGGLINPTLNNTEIELVTPELFDNVAEFKEGGELNNYSEIELVNPDSIEDEIEEFKDGGEINIIPEGALHARKHNMETEGITKKGIPVVAEKEGGELEQQAEIEREEIIFRLEVTKKLESLEKKYYSEETSQKEKDELALEAGKLLTEEILHNTQDNTNNLL